MILQKLAVVTFGCRSNIFTIQFVCSHHLLSVRLPKQVRRVFTVDRIVGVLTSAAVIYTIAVLAAPRSIFVSRLSFSLDTVHAYRSCVRICIVTCHHTIKNKTMLVERSVSATVHKRIATVEFCFTLCIKLFTPSSQIHCASVKKCATLFLTTAVVFPDEFLYTIGYRNGCCTKWL